MRKFIGVYGLIALVALSMILTVNAQGLNVWKEDAGETTITLEWDAPNTNEIGYFKLFRDNLSDAEPRKFVRVFNFPDHSWTDTKLTSNSMYNYTIEKYNESDIKIDEGYTIACTIGWENIIDWKCLIAGIVTLILTIILIIFGGGFTATPAGKALIGILFVACGILFYFGISNMELVSPC